MTMTTVSASATRSRQVVAARERWRVRASGVGGPVLVEREPARVDLADRRHVQVVEDDVEAPVGEGQAEGQAHPSAPAHDDQVGREPPLGAIRPEPGGYAGRESRPPASQLCR